jgi:succinyl-CoA synthetase alpha subunit
LGIGGDRLHGVGFVEALATFEADEGVDKIVLIGEIGGAAEQLAADYIRRSVRKPVYGYVVGHSAVAGQQLGHAGAIMGGVDESAAAKTAALRDAGVRMAMSLPELVELVKNS